MRSRINSVQPVMVMRVTGSTQESPDIVYHQSFEWGNANVEGYKEIQDSLKTDEFFNLSLETLVKVKIDKTLMRDLDFSEFEISPIVLYIPSTDTVEDRYQYDTNNPWFYSGWWVVSSSAPSFRQYKGGGYSEVVAQAMHFYLSGESANTPSFVSLRQYYESGKDPLVEHPNPNDVVSIENSVGNLDFTVGE